MTSKEFIGELAKLNIILTPDQITALATYKDLLQEYNQKFNLTALTTDKDIYLKHFYDSLTLIKAIDLNQNLKILDIGTGAGFPGLVLKIVYPHLALTLLDSNTKKISFLTTVINKLNLTNITCLNCRVEDLGPNYYEYFDVITSRAVASLRILSELSIAYLKINGYFIPLKGYLDEELTEAKPTLKILGYDVVDIISFKLPILNDTRTIIKLQKNQKTPNIYPRTYDKIKKHPLK